MFNKITSEIRTTVETLNLTKFVFSFLMVATIFVETSHADISDFDTLNISPSASQAEIKKAYRRMSSKHHPDKNLGNEEEAHEKMLEIRAAYERLSKGSAKKINSDFSAHEDFIKKYELVLISVMNPYFMPVLVEFARDFKKALKSDNLSKYMSAEYWPHRLGYTNIMYYEIIHSKYTAEIEKLLMFGLGLRFESVHYHMLSDFLHKSSPRKDGYKKYPRIAYELVFNAIDPKEKGRALSLGWGTKGLWDDRENLHSLVIENKDKSVASSIIAKVIHDSSGLSHKRIKDLISLFIPLANSQKDYTLLPAFLDNEKISQDKDIFKMLILKLTPNQVDYETLSKSMIFHEEKDFKIILDSLLLRAPTEELNRIATYKPKLFFVDEKPHFTFKYLQDRAVKALEFDSEESRHRYLYRRSSKAFKGLITLRDIDLPSSRRNSCSSFFK